MVQEFGRSSLFVYWVHVELVYGVLSGPLRHSLSLEASVAATLGVTMLMVALVFTKNRIVSAGRARSIPEARIEGASI
jgi:hypothetical protein